MKQAVVYGARDVRIEDVSPPDAPTGDEILVRVRYSGLCGTDLRRWQGLLDRPFPVVLGHEYAGEVEAVGADVTRVKVGDRVAIHPYVFCDYCHYCRNGMPEYCMNRTSYTNGWSEYVRVPESVAFLVPDGMSLRVAALMEPLGAAIHATDLAHIEPGDNVLVLGGGPVGLMCAMIARLNGASLTVVSEPSSVRRDLAVKLGADAAVDPIGQDLPAMMAELTDNEGFDIALDCVTSGKSLESAAEVLLTAGTRRTKVRGTIAAKRKSTLIVVGNARPDDTMTLPNMDRIHYHPLVIKGATMRRDIAERALRILRRGGFDDVVSHTGTLDDLPDLLRLSEQGQVGKVLIEL